LIDLKDKTDEITRKYGGGGSSGGSGGGIASAVSAAFDTQPYYDHSNSGNIAQVNFETHNLNTIL
jgi:hypothetical protein